VKDASGNLPVSTQATVPTSDEINCAKCHTAGSLSVFMNILTSPDNAIGTTLVGQKPILCASCHGSPHAMYPPREAKDNYQPEHYQGSKIKSIGNCGVCHDSSISSPLSLINSKLKTQNLKLKNPRRARVFVSTRSRNRTGTNITVHWILSPTRLPIPPPGPKIENRN
jgi:hypothetical protein